MGQSKEQEHGEIQTLSKIRHRAALRGIPERGIHMPTHTWACSCTQRECKEKITKDGTSESERMVKF